MTPVRKPPHCKTCHKPLKGHKRGVCDPTDIPAGASASDYTTTRSVSAEKTSRSAMGRSKFPPFEPLPTLSPQSSQILNELLRTNSQSSPPIKVPPIKRTRRGTFLWRDAESLHLALEQLSASDEKKSKMPSECMYTPTEVKECQLSGFEKPQPMMQASSSSVFRELKVEQVSTSDHAPDMTIKDLLDSTVQSSRYPPAAIFSYPAGEVSALEGRAHHLGLIVHALPLPFAGEGWVPVIVGTSAGAVKKLLEDSEKLAQEVRRSGASGVREFHVGMSHIVVGTLGALATWAGLAYN